eukprot:215844-Amphidinium_carterae.1
MTARARVLSPAALGLRQSPQLPQRLLQMNTTSVDSSRLMAVNTSMDSLYTSFAQHKLQPYIDSA